MRGRGFFGPGFWWRGFYPYPFFGRGRGFCRFFFGFPWWAYGGMPYPGYGMMPYGPYGMPPYPGMFPPY